LFTLVKTWFFTVRQDQTASLLILSMNLRQELYMNGFANSREDNGANPISENCCIHKLLLYNCTCVILSPYKCVSWTTIVVHNRDRLEILWNFPIEHTKNHPRRFRFTWKSVQTFLYNSLAHQNIVKRISYSVHSFWCVSKSAHFSILLLFFISFKRLEENYSVISH